MKQVKMPLYESDLPEIEMRDNPNNNIKLSGFRLHKKQIYILYHSMPRVAIGKCLYKEKLFNTFLSSSTITS